MGKWADELLDGSPPPAGGEGGSGRNWSGMLLDGPQDAPPPTAQTADDGLGIYKPDVSRAWDWVTGKGRRVEGIPEITSLEGLPSGTSAALAGGLVTATDPQQAIDVVRRQLPDAEITEDQYGNPVVNYQGNAYYLNKPGVTMQDMNQLVGQSVGYAATMLPAGRALRGGNLAMRAGGQGATAATTSMLFDQAAKLFGSEQPVNTPRAATVGALATGFEVLAPAVGAAWGALRRGARERAVRADMGRMLQEAGLTPEQLTDDTVDNFVRIARDAASPEDALRMAEAQGLPVPVRLTRGDVTQNPIHQMNEDLAAKGVYGQQAQGHMGGARAQQQEQLRANVPAIQERIGGGQIDNFGQGGAQAQAGLAAQNRRITEGVDVAYDTARQATGTIPGEIIPTLRHRIGSAVANRLRHAPGAMKELERLSAMQADDAGVMVKALFDWRRDVSDLANNALKNTPDAPAMRAMLREFDSAMDDMAVNGLLSGNQETVALWQQAVGMRRNQGRMFGGKRGGKPDLVNRLVNEESGEMIVAPEAVSNLIFGNSTGFISRPHLTRELRKVRNLLGPRSPEWNAMREEVFLRLAAQGEGALSGTTRLFSGAKFSKAWERFGRDNPTMQRLMFDAQERALIGQFARVATRTTSRVAGGALNSTTTVGLANVASKMWSALFLGQRGRQWLAAQWGIDRMVRGGRNIQAGSASTGAVPTRNFPAGPLGITGATVGREVYD
jgi:hypothetical protein